VGTVRERSDRGRFQLDYVDADGIRRRPMCPKGTKRSQAEKMLREIEAGVRSGLAPRRRTLTSTTVDDLFTAWLESGAHRWSPQTIEMRTRFIETRILPALGPRVADTVTPADLSSWLEALPLSAHTVANLRGMVRIAWGWGLERGLVTDDPSVGLKAPKIPRGIPRYLTAEEYDRALELAQGDTRDAIILGVRTGLRLGELLGLQWRDVQGSTLVVIRSLDRLTERPRVPKSRKPRRVPIHPEAASVLARRGPGAPTERIVDLKYHKARMAITRVLRLIGIERGGPHLLRHTCASWWVQDGGSLMALQRLLGHATLEMTLVYAHLAPDSLEQEAARLWGPLGTTPGRQDGSNGPQGDHRADTADRANLA